MLLKDPDDKSMLLAEVDRLAAEATPSKWRQIVERTQTLRAGIKGEKESAYLKPVPSTDEGLSIDFH